MVLLCMPYKSEWIIKQAFLSLIYFEILYYSNVLRFYNLKFKVNHMDI